MKTCKKFEFLMSRGLDDDLNKRETKKLKKHLSVCPNCMAKANSFLAMRKAFGEKDLQENCLSLLLQEIKSEKEKNSSANRNTEVANKGVLSFPNMFSQKSRRYVPAAAIFIGIVLLFGYRNSDLNIAFTQKKSAQKTVTNQSYMAVDYPMGGILSYKANSAETNDVNIETSISDVYVENYAPELNSYFTYVGYGK